MVYAASVCEREYKTNHQLLILIEAITLGHHCRWSHHLPAPLTSIWTRCNLLSGKTP